MSTDTACETARHNEMPSGCVYYDCHRAQMPVTRLYDVELAFALPHARSEEE